MFLILLIMLAIVSGLGGTIWYTLQNGITPTARLEAGLSNPAKKLVREYNSLPSESCPFPDIYSIVRALDEQAEDRELLDAHFMCYPNRYGSNQTRQFFWLHENIYCKHNRVNYCDYTDYYRIHAAIEDVSNSIVSKERAVLESRLKPDLDMIDELESRLREEVKLNESFAKEYKELA